MIRLERDVPAPLPAVWAAVSDFAAHRLPLTRISTDPGPPRVGWRFVGWSGLGRVGFADSMVLTRWSPPQPSPLQGPQAPSPVSSTASYAVVKTGRVLTGWATVSLTALDAHLTRLVWTEQILVHPYAMGALLEPITDLAVRAMFRRAVDRMLEPLA